MDGPRFDDLTKALAAATPTRRGVVGGAVAAVFTGVVRREAGPKSGQWPTTSPASKTARSSSARIRRPPTRSRPANLPPRAVSAPRARTRRPVPSACNNRPRGARQGSTRAMSTGTAPRTRFASTFRTAARSTRTAGSASRNAPPKVELTSVAAVAPSLGCPETARFFCARPPPDRWPMPFPRPMPPPVHRCPSRLPCQRGRPVLVVGRVALAHRRRSL